MENKNWDLLKFYVKGSLEEPYRVSFWRVGNDFKSACNCQAGKKGVYCKHRFNLMDGDISNLVSENHEELVKLSNMIKGSDVEHVYEEFCSLKKEEEKIKKRIRELTNQLKVTMR